MNKCECGKCDCLKRLNISKALLNAQKEFDIIEANFTNNQYKNKYAKLVDIYNATKKHLRAQNILVNHYCITHPDTHQQMTRTVLTHVPTGETIEDNRFLISEKPGNQGHGTSDTYMKKYGLKSLLGTDIGEEDDDGVDESLYLNRVDLLKEYINSKTTSYEAKNKIYEKLRTDFAIKDLKS